MDKYEYKLRSEEIVKLIEQEKYEEAVKIADIIDWRRVKSLTMLLKVAALYRVNRRQEDCRAILMIAYERYPSNRSVVSALCEVSIELDDVVAAIEYYKEFVKLAPRDNGVFTLRYRILEAQEASLEERIELLEEFKKRDYQEEWAYELAYLYHRVGLATKCIEECDDLILWFGDGPYVIKAMELKMLHAPLTAIQEKNYQNMMQEVKGIPEDEEYAQQDAYAYEQQESYGESEYSYGNAEYEQPQHSYEEAAYEQPQDAYGNEAYDKMQDSYGSEVYEQPQDVYADARYEQMQDSYEDATYEQETAYAEETEASYGAAHTATKEAAENNGDAYREQSFVDMSQYNTINLQKVVAESMRELFPDDASIYEENKKEVERIENASGRYVPVPVPVEEFIAQKEEEQQTIPSDPEVIQDIHKESHIQKMLTGVSERMPEPNSGAIKKVILPGVELNAMTDAPEQEYETTYETVKSQEEEVPFRPMTGQINIEDVLQEWERMKKENEEKRKEEIKQLVIQQTGQLFAHFEQESKSGVLAGLDEPETYEPQTYEPQYQETQQTDSELAQPDENKSYRVETIFEEEPDESLESEVEELVEEPIYEETDYEAEEIAEEPVYEETDYETEEVAEEPVYEETDYETEEVVEEPVYEETDYETEEVVEEPVYEETDYETEEVAEEPVQEETDYVAEEVAEEPVQEETDYVAEEVAEEPVQEETDYETEEVAEEPVQEETDYETEEIAKEPAQTVMETQEISLNTQDISELPNKIIATTKKETKGIKKEELREFTEEEKGLFDDFAATKKIKRQIISTIEQMSLASYVGNVLITGEAGLGTIRLSKNLIKAFKLSDDNFSGKVAKISGEKINQRDIKEVFDQLKNGALIIESANGMTEDTLYQIALRLNQEDFGIIVFFVDTKKGITKLLEKQAMIADYFTCRVDLVEMDNNALVAYAKNYAMALEYSIDDLGTLALYTRIANSQSGNHVVTKDEVREIVDEAIYKSKKPKLKNFVDVILSKRYDKEDMIVLKERDFM